MQCSDHPQGVEQRTSTHWHRCAGNCIGVKSLTSSQWPPAFVHCQLGNLLAYTLLDHQSHPRVFIHPGRLPSNNSVVLVLKDVIVLWCFSHQNINKHFQTQVSFANLASSLRIPHSGESRKVNIKNIKNITNIKNIKNIKSLIFGWVWGQGVSKDDAKNGLVGEGRLKRVIIEISVLNELKPLTAAWGGQGVMVSPANETGMCETLIIVKYVKKSKMQKFRFSESKAKVMFFSATNSQLASGINVKNVESHRKPTVNA